MNCKLNYLYEKFPDNPEFAQHLEQIELSIWKTFKDEKFPTFEYEGKRYYSISPKMSKERKKQMKILQSLRDKYNSPNLFLTKKLYPFDYDLITIRMGTIVSSQKELFDVLQKNKPKKPPEEKEAYPSIYEETYEKFLRFNSNTSNPQSSENKNINNQQKNVVYSAIFFNTNELTNKYNQVHPNLYSHHSTIEFKPQTIENLPVGENRNIRIIGRLTTDKVDVLIVDNPLSKNKFPHITLSTAEGVKPFESNSEIEKNQNKIKPLNDIIVGKVGYFDGKNEIVNDEKFDENYNLNKIKSGVEELFDSNPELANIGTAEQYSQYLDTIFPDSKVRAIVNKQFEEFNKIPKILEEDVSKIYDEEKFNKYQIVKNLENSKIDNLQKGLEWIRQVMPDANVELVDELIDGIGRGSYNTVTDLVTLSEKYADKRTAKHEIFHRVFNSLSKEKQEELLNEGSKLFGIPRGNSKVKVKHSKLKSSTKITDLGINIEEEFNEDYWKNLYNSVKLVSKFSKELKKIPNAFKPDEYYSYHGTREFEIDKQGNLILNTSVNFGNVESLSLTNIPVVAFDYSLRKGDYLILDIKDLEKAEQNLSKGREKLKYVILKISNDVLKDVKLQQENNDEYSTSETLIISKDKYEIITNQTAEELNAIKLKQYWESLSELEQHNLFENKKEKLREILINNVKENLNHLTETKSKRERIKNLIRELIYLKNKKYDDFIISERNEYFNGGSDEISKSELTQRIYFNTIEEYLYFIAELENDLNKEKVILSLLKPLVKDLSESEILSYFNNENIQIYSHWDNELRPYYEDLKESEFISNILKQIKNINLSEDLILKNPFKSEEQIKKIEAKMKLQEEEDWTPFQTDMFSYEGDLAIEEKIAEMMENTPDEKLPKTILGRWIQSVRNFFRNLFKERNKIERLLRNINQGKFGDNKKYQQNLIDNSENKLYKNNQEVKYQKLPSQLDKNQSNQIEELKQSDPRWNKYSNEDIQRFIDSVFPESKVKEIVYHGTDSIFEKFDKYKFREGQQGNGLMFSGTITSIEKEKGNQVEGFYFLKEKTSNYGKIILPVLLNIKNPKDFGKNIETMFFGDINPTYEKLSFVTPEELKEYKKNNIDSLIGEVTGVGNEIVVFEPEQIYILNSEKAISDMEKFVGGKPTFNKELVQNIQKLFESNPELANIGTAEQYSQYLDTIFPDSKVKDIVYHGSGVNIISREGWKTGKETGTGHRGVLGYYFSKYLLDAKIYAQRAGSPKATPESLLQQGYIVPTIVNAQNKTTETEVYDRFAEIRRWDENYAGFDTVTYGQGLDENKEVVVKSKEQIHILGSKKDVEGFKKFVNQNQIEDNVFINNIASYDENFEKYNKLFEDNSKNYFQLNSFVDIYDNTKKIERLVEEANLELNNRLINYLKKYNITVKDIKEFENTNKIDAIGVTDILNKIIYIDKKRESLDTLPEEAAHMFTFLLKHTSEMDKMINSIDKWEGYSKVYNDYYSTYEGNIEKIKVEAVGKFIALHLIKQEPTVSKEIKENIFKTLWKFVLQLFEYKNDLQQLNRYAKEIATKVFNNEMLLDINNNSDVALVDFKTALKNDFLATQIHNKMKNYFTLTGSAALSTQGTIYRKSKNLLHDLDYIASEGQLVENKIKELFPNSIKFHNGWRHGDYTTKSYIVPPLGISIINVNRENGNWVEEYDLIDKNLKVVGSYTSKIIDGVRKVRQIGIKALCIDVFDYDKSKSSETFLEFTNWDAIFKAKLEFAREKDIKDWVNFINYKYATLKNDQFLFYQKEENDDKKFEDNVSCFI